MEQPAWLAAAWAEFGVREAAGASDEPAVLRYFREAGHGEITHDATPWCAAFLGAVLQRAGLNGTGSLMARSYLGWGEVLDAARIGSIVVLSRGDDPSAGHVGLYVGAAKERVFLLGGNQGDAVSVEAFDAGRVLGYRWPNGATVETPPPPPVSEAGIFDRALVHVLEMEGGYSNDPYDPGGPTNKGITLNEFAKWRSVTVTAVSKARLIAALKDIDAETVADIYRARYWQPASCAALPGAVAVMHFDAAVNHGVGGATRLLQAALGVTADGEIGPESLGAVRGQPARTIVERYAELRRARYRALPHFWRFGRGWLRRVDTTEALALSLAVEGSSGEPITNETAKGTTNMTDDFRFPLPGEAPGQDAREPGGKWWPQSKTVWGALITAVTTVLPVLGPLIGINISAEMIALLGDQAVLVIQAAGGLIGTLLTLYGRAQATAPLVRQDVKVRM
jgi:uncharacterized protein (TIGR02594 family)